MQRFLDILTKLQVPAAMVLCAVLAASMAGAFPLPDAAVAGLAVAAAALGVPRPRELASDWAGRAKGQ